MKASITSVNQAHEEAAEATAVRSTASTCCKATVSKPTSVGESSHQMQPLRFKQSYARSYAYQVRQKIPLEYQEVYQVSVRSYHSYSWCVEDSSSNRVETLAKGLPRFDGKDERAYRDWKARTKTHLNICAPAIYHTHGTRNAPNPTLLLAEQYQSLLSPLPGSFECASNYSCGSFTTP